MSREHPTASGILPENPGFINSVQRINQVTAVYRPGIDKISLLLNEETSICLSAEMWEEVIDTVTSVLNDLAYPTVQDLHDEAMAKLRAKLTGSTTPTFSVVFNDETREASVEL